MKTNIKIRVTPEQSKKVQEICFENGIEWINAGRRYIGNIIILYIGKVLMFSGVEFPEAFKEIDADLFIRTNGNCEENELKDFIQSQDENIDRVNNWTKEFNDISLKLKKKNEILKKARIKRKNQREELHKLNLKLQKCISLGEHRKVLDWHIERNESLFAEIDKLKAENKSLKESSKISCNMLHSQKDKIDRLKLNYVAEQSNYKKEIEKLKAVIEYLESKVK